MSTNDEDGTKFIQNLIIDQDEPTLRLADEMNLSFPVVENTALLPDQTDRELQDILDEGMIHTGDPIISKTLMAST